MATAFKRPDSRAAEILSNPKDGIFDSLVKEVEDKGDDATEEMAGIAVLVLVATTELKDAIFPFITADAA